MSCCGASTVGIATFGISRLVKTSANDKKEEPSQDLNDGPNMEHEGKIDQSSTIAEFVA